jgi:hypothetical protein
MEERLHAEELRCGARYVEETAFSALASYSTIPIQHYSGSPTDFPRASREEQAAEEGIAALRAAMEQAVLSLYTVALAVDRKLPVPPALLVSVQRYIDAFRAQQRTEPDQTA